MSSDRLEFADGSVLTVLESAADRARDPLIIEFRVPHGGMPTAPHSHPRQTETYAVQEGSMEVLIGHEWSTLSAGESATVRPGTPHAFRNRSGFNVTFLNTHGPDLRFEEYIRAVHRLAEAGKLRGGADPRSVLYACALMREYGETIQAAGKFQHAAVALLAGVARLVGVKASGHTRR